MSAPRSDSTRNGARDLRNGVITLGVLAVAIFLAFNGGLPFGGEEGRTVVAELEQANNLHPGDPVRVAGVDVGEVSEVELAADPRHARVTLRILDDGLDLRADASVRARMRSLTGGTRYVELDPGSARRSLGDEVIPVRRTAAAVEFDDLLGVFRERQRGGVRALGSGLDRALRGGAAGASIDRVGPAWRVGVPALRALRGRRPGELTELVRGAGRTWQALARDERALADLLESAAGVFAVTAARSAELDRTLALAPGTLADTERVMARLRPTLGQLAETADDLRPSAVELGPAAAELTPLMAELDAALDRARPVARHLPPVAKRLAPLSRAGAAAFDGLEPTVIRTRDELIPFLNARDPDTGLRNYEAIGPGLSAAGNATSEFDANGYMLRFQTAPSERTLGSLPCQSLLTDPSRKELLRCDALETVLGDIFGNFGLDPRGLRR